MQHHRGRFMPQPFTGVMTLLVALGLLIGPWLGGAIHLGSIDKHTPETESALLSLFLLSGLVLSHRFPIHIRGNTKIYVGSAALFLMAALLPPPVAVAAAGLGALAGECMVRAQRGLLLSDIATQTGRLMIVVLVASLAAHLSLGADALSAIPLAAAALILWAGDIVTLPLVLYPITGERPRRIVLATLRSGAVPEGAQYLVGIMGTLVARQEMWALVLLILPTALVYLAFKSAERMRTGTRQMLAAMADTVDLRDPYTGGHSRRVADLAEGILRQLNRSGPEAQLVIWAARVHDIGKIGIPDEVLNKEGPLTADERELMETHPDRGAWLLQRYPDFQRGVEVVRHHHERWDGEGYPHRLKGADIPFGARVIAVADSFDAMTSDRPYRRSLSPDTAAAVLREGCGKQWDPNLVDAFLRSIQGRLREPVTPVLWLVPDPPHEGEIGPAAESV